MAGGSWAWVVGGLPGALVWLTFPLWVLLATRRGELTDSPGCAQTSQRPAFGSACHRRSRGNAFRQAVPIGASSLGAQTGVIAAADLTLLLPDTNETDDGAGPRIRSGRTPHHSLRPPSRLRPSLPLGREPRLSDAVDVPTDRRPHRRRVNLFLAFYVLGLIPDRARGRGGAGAPAAVVACRRRARRVPGGPQAARRVSSVISLGAKIRNGGPQKPVPRLV